jgi:hypothetical protein
MEAFRSLRVSTDLSFRTPREHVRRQWNLNVTVGEAGQYGVAINYSQFVVKYTCRMIKYTRAEYLVSPTIRLSLQRSYPMRLDCDSLEYSTRLTVLILIMEGPATGSSHHALKKRTYARKSYVHVMH